MNNKSVKSGFGIGCIIFVAAALIAIPLRTIQFFTVLEGGTGFYSETDWSVYLLFGVLAVSIIAFLVFGFTKRKTLEYSLETTKRPGLSSLSLIAACGLALDAFSCLMKYSTVEPSATAMDSPVNASQLILMIEAVFALLSAIYFILLWLTYLNGKSNASKIRLLALAPVIWSILRIVIRFMRTISYIRVSDLLFEMIMIAFLILFFMALAQANTGISAEKVEWKLGAYGLPAALLALICFVPRLIVMISGNSHLFYSESTVEFCDLGVALFIIGTVLTRVTDRIPEANN
ncbi:MAG: hypothetical protein IKW12_00475 [Clostridia bacterium]|nr:hypothetical protein [Clostridia bacterium]